MSVDKIPSSWVLFQAVTAVLLSVASGNKELKCTLTRCMWVCQLARPTAFSML